MFWRHKKSDKISVCINFKLSLWLRQRDGIYNYPVYKLSYREIEEIQLDRGVERSPCLTRSEWMKPTSK